MRRRAEATPHMTQTIEFLLGMRTSRTGSAYLRATQLEYFLREDLRHLGFSSSVQVGIRNPSPKTTYFLSKSYIIDHGLNGIAPLASAGHQVIVDPIDMDLDTEEGKIAVKYATKLISSAIEQDGYLRSIQAPGQQTFFVPHHVDVRIPPAAAQQTQFRMAYFGSRLNLLMPRQIRPNGPFRPGGTGCHVYWTEEPRNTTWIPALQSFSCHYNIRPPRREHIFKPFTKGHIAAHVGAVILGARSDREAVLNLGDDYPFLYDINSPGDIVLAVDDIAGAFQSDRWQLAQRRMSGLKAIVDIDNVKKTVLEAIVA